MKRWDGVADGTRTHDDQNHNLGLYQLSYSHRRACKYSVAERRGTARAQGVAAEAAAAAAATSASFTSTLKRFFSDSR